MAYSKGPSKKRRAGRWEPRRRKCVSVYIAWWKRRGDRREEGRRRGGKEKKERFMHHRRIASCK